MPSRSLVQADVVLRRVLVQQGLRYTRQRGEIYRLLRSTADHPTALDIRERLRGACARLSLATVYKTLDTLVACGLVSRVALEDGPARFDARTDDHGHLRCLRCASVRDLPDGYLREILDATASTVQWSVDHYRLEVAGLCEECDLGIPCEGCAGRSRCRAVSPCTPHREGSVSPGRRAAALGRALPPSGKRH
jgi:Fe2+ or Zn2+ uptake regulation protein